MNTKQDQVLEPDRIPGRSDGATDSDADSHLHVTVLVTSAERTIAALSAARNLTAGLGLRLTLLAIEEVPFRVPLDKPLVSLDFKQVQLQTFLAKSGIEQEDVNVRVCLCRDRNVGLLHALLPRSVVVLGGGRNWWSFGERQLEKTLREIGHTVICASTDDARAPNAVDLSEVLGISDSRNGGEPR